MLQGKLQLHRNQRQVELLLLLTERHVRVLRIQRETRDCGRWCLRDWVTHQVWRDKQGQQRSLRQLCGYTAPPSLHLAWGLSRKQHWSVKGKEGRKVWAQPLQVGWDDQSSPWQSIKLDAWWLAFVSRQLKELESCFECLIEKQVHSDVQSFAESGD